jgi:hypothetical protein
MSRSSCVQGARIELLLAMPAQPITPSAALQESRALLEEEDTAFAAPAFDHGQGARHRNGAVMKPA